MSRALQSEVAAATERAKKEGHKVEQDLTAKGVAFGRVVVAPDGAVDTGAVEGVDRDLTIRPFGWKGHQATLRAMIEESLHIHQSLISTRIQEAVHAGSLDGKPYGSGRSPYDLDDDGVTLEIDPGMLTTVVVPGATRSTDHAAATIEVARRLCRRTAGSDAPGSRMSCPDARAQDPKLDVRFEPDREPKGPPLVINVAKDGDGPKIEPRYPVRSRRSGASVQRPQRHDMGDAREPVVGRHSPGCS
jgi:hypothetical protein